MESQVTEKTKDSLNFFFICTAVTICAFIVLIANELTNTYDGLWQGSYYVLYEWVISIGRWFWPLVGKARLDMSPEPFTTILSILLTVCGGCLVAEWFGIKNTWKKYAVVLLSSINTSVCVWLSYRYMSPTFTFSYLLSVLGVYIIRKEQSVWRVVVAVLCLVLSLGCYQANIGCACLLLLFNIVYILQRSKSGKRAIRFGAYSAGTVLVSCILYKIIWDIVLKVLGMEAASYRGANSLSFLVILKNMPKTIVNAYRVFFGYFFNNSIKHDAYQQFFIYKAILIVSLALFIIAGGIRAASRKPIFTATYAACCLLIPLAANVSLLLAADEGDVLIQQTMPMAVMLPFLAAAVEIRIDEERFDNILTTAGSVLLSCLLLGSFMMVSVDQHTMLVGRENSVAFMHRAFVDIAKEELPSDGYIFLGKPSDNPLFLKDELWYRANEYARYGEFVTDGDCNYQSYAGLMRDAGINISVNWAADYWHELEGQDEFRNLPAYPITGYITQVDNVTVVKVSQY